MTIIGEEFIRVRPDTTTFLPELEAKLAAANVGGIGGLGGLGGAITPSLEGAAAEVGAATGAITKDIEGVAVAATPATKEVESVFTNMARLVQGRAGEMRGGIGLLENGLTELDKAGFGASAGLESVVGGSAAATTGVLAAAAVAVAGVAAFEHFGEAVYKTTSITGAGAEQASRFNFALNAEGVSAETAARSLVRFAKNLETGTTDLSKYGLTVAKTADGSVDLIGTVLNLADAMQALGPGAESSALAVQVLGRGATNLIPILVQGRGAVEALFAKTPGDLIFTDEQAKQAHEFSVQLKELKLEVEGLATSLGKDLAPAAIDLVKVLEGTVKAVDPLIKAVGFVLKPIVDGIEGAVVAFGHVPPAANDAKKGLQSLALTADELAAAEADAKTRAADMTSQLNAMSSAAGQLLGDQRSIDNANKAVATSTATAAKAQADYNTLLRVGGADLVALATATRAQRDATVALEEANQGIIDSGQKIHEQQLKLAEAADIYGANSEEARRATVDLSDAQVAGDVAANRQTDAADNLAKANQDVIDASSGSAAAAKRLQDAQALLSTASQTVADDLQAAATATAAYWADLAKANGVTVSAQGSTENLILALNAQADSLAPDSPYRKNLSDAAAELQGFVDKQNALAASIIGQQQAAQSLTGGVPGDVAQGILGAKLGYTGIQINLYPAQGQDPTEIAKQIIAISNNGLPSVSRLGDNSGSSPSGLFPGLNDNG